MSEATFEGATVEAALEAAASKMGAEASELDYEVVEEKPDFWGTGGGTVVIKARPRVEAPAEPEKPAESPEELEKAAPREPEPSVPASREQEQADEPREPMGDGEPGEVATAAIPATMAWEAPEAETAAASDEAETPPAPAAGQDVAVERAATKDVKGEDAPEGVEPAAISGMLEQIFHDMEFECTVTVEPEDDGFLATVDGADKDALLEGNGRCLSALELLINNAFRHKLPRGNKVRVDAGDFRNKRDEELADLAFQVAHSAKDSGRTQETQPLNPYERRLVHLALAEDPAVTTRSRGSGFLKNVQVIPRGASGDRSRGRRD